LAEYQNPVLDPGGSKPGLLAESKMEGELLENAKGNSIFTDIY